MSSVGSESQSSRSSFSTGGGGSVVSDSDGAALANVNGGEQDDNAHDSLDQNKGVWDAAFSCLLLLTKNRSVTSYRMLAFRVMFEYLQIFRLVFNTRFRWVINTSLWIWKCMYWVLFRFVVWNRGYPTYVKGLYVICAVVLLLVLLTIVIGVVLRKDDSSNPWLKRLIWFVQNAGLLVFSICWVSLFDYMVFMFSCLWGHKPSTHIKWTDQKCAAMPHLGSMVLAGVTAVIFVVSATLLAVAECSGNLLSNNLLATPVATAVLKTTLLKILMVLVSTCLDEFRKPQAVLMFICPVLSTYFQITWSPYLLPWMNHLWTGLWAGLVYTTSLLLALNFVEVEEPFDYEVPGLEMDFRVSMTYAVLYGIFPAIAAGAAVSHVVYKRKMAPLQLFKAAQQAAKDNRMQLETVSALKSIYRFHSPEQVQFLARCVHAFDPVTDQPLAAATALGGIVIQAGMARFPNDPGLLVLYSNYIIHVRKQPRAARQQLQLAAKFEPSSIERFNIFCALDTLKKSSSDGEQGLDLMAYVDQQRQIRACMKAHKLALLTQRAFWRCIMRDSLLLSDMLDALATMQKAEQAATYVYKRVLERYPQNGKLLKIWGRYQEWVLHDPARASKSYAEAVKRGVSENLLNLTADEQDGSLEERSKVDEKTDGIIIIDAIGTLLLVNKTAYRMFAYDRGELEGKNVSMLMPSPFSERHNSYLRNYINTGVAKIINQDRQVVCLRKNRAMFPSDLWVRRLSGTGTESVYMGVLRAVDESDPNIVRVWTSMSGLILCSDSRFGDWFGVPAEDVAGKPFSSLGKTPDVLERFVVAAGKATPAQAAAGQIKCSTGILHKFLDAIDVDITVKFAGSDTEQILVLNIRCLTDTQRLMVVDKKGSILYVTSPLAALLATKVPALTNTNMRTLVPPPAAQMHALWMKEMLNSSKRPRLGSCRSGSVVHLLTATGAQVPVRLAISSRSEAAGDKVACRHIVKVTKATQQELQGEQRLQLTVNNKGVVTSASSSTPKTLFGFDPAVGLVGRPLASFITQFEQFRVQLRQGSAAGSGGAAPGAAATAAAAAAAAAQSNAGEGGSSSGQMEQRYSQISLQLQRDLSNAEQAAAAGLEQQLPFSGTGSTAADDDDSVLLTLLGQASQQGSDASYRVGVRSLPLADADIGKQRTAERGAAASGTSAEQWSSVIGGSRDITHAGVMAVSVVELDLSSGGGSAADDVQFEVLLWRAELLSGVLEVDQALTVLRANDATGHMLGCKGSTLQRKLLKRLFQLPKHISSAADLLQQQTTSHKHATSALKSSKAKEGRVGPQISVKGVHADGGEVHMQIQAVAKDGTSTSRVQLVVKLAAKPDTSSLAALLQLAGATDTESAAATAAGPAKTGLGSVAAVGSNSMKPARAAPAAAALGGGDRPKAGAGLLRSSFNSSRADDEEQGSETGEPAAAVVGRGRAAGAANRASGEQAAAGRAVGRRRGSGSEAGGDGSGSETAAAGGGAAAGRAARAGSPGSDDRQPSMQGTDDEDEDGAGYLQHQQQQRQQPAGAGARFAGRGAAAGRGGGADKQRFREEEDGLPAGEGEGDWPRLQSENGKIVARGFRRKSAEYAAGGAGSRLPPQQQQNGLRQQGAAGDEVADDDAGSADGGWDGAAGLAQLPEPGRQRRLSGTGSEADSEADRGMDAGTAITSEAADDENADITCDWRRAKRLRRIKQQLDSPLARQPLQRFWRGMWLAAGVLLAIQVACFAVLASTVKTRQTDVFGVQRMAEAIDQSQMIMLRSNLASKCGMEEFKDADVCVLQQGIYLAKLIHNVEELTYLHKGIFLGFNPDVLHRLKDPRLMSWWKLPHHEEVFFLDTAAGGNLTSRTSLWDLGNKYIYTAREVIFAITQGMDGEDMEARRDWKYIAENGMHSMFKGYAVSLDMYVRFCWHDLGKLGGLLIELMVAELVGLAVLVMAWVLTLIRQVAGQRMACFSVFLSLPSAMLRGMATASCQVDDEDAGSDGDADDLELRNATGAQTQAAVPVGGSSSVTAGKGKSVRMSVAGEPGKPGGVFGGKGKGKQGSKQDGWFAAKYKAARHSARGLLNRTLRINGKQLHPARGVFARFMAPLLLWWMVALTIYAMSLDDLGKLQQPLTSLQTAAHVQFYFARVRMLANFVVFLREHEFAAQWEQLNVALTNDLANMKYQYYTLLYGGVVPTMLTDEPPVIAPPAVFQAQATANVFFQTDECLRLDKSTCLPTTSPWYKVTHSGLDAQFQEFIKDMEQFSRLPAINQTIDTPSYQYNWRVAAIDLYEGLHTASDTFVGTTLDALGKLQTLHTILLISTLGLLVYLVLVVLVPFRRQLLTESGRIAGLLSQLPQEADVEGQVKSLVVAAAIAKPKSETTSKNWSIAKGVSAAAASAARAAATRAAGAVGNFKSKLAAAERVASNPGYQDMEGGGAWQNEAGSDDDAGSDYDE